MNISTEVVSIYLLISTITWISCKRDDNRPVIAKTVYSLRISNFTECPDFPVKPFLYDVKFTYHENQHYVSAKFNLSDIRVKRMIATIDRCTQNNYNCEYFQTWNTTQYCLFSKMKNRPWSLMYESVTPSSWLDNCPFIKKGTYTMNNATVDPYTIPYYQEASRYHWKARLSVFDQTSEQFCSLFSFYVISYTRKSFLW